MHVPHPGARPTPPVVHDARVSDPFPHERLAAFMRRLPSYARLAWNLGRDPLLSKGRRATVLAAAGYLVSPVDLIPGIIPVLGQLDDLLVLLAALRFALQGLDPEQRAAHLRAVGLSDSMLVEDVGALGLTAAWLARAGARTAVKVGRAGMRVGVSAARRVVPVALRGAQRGARWTGHEVATRVRRPTEGEPSPQLPRNVTGTAGPEPPSVPRGAVSEPPAD